MRKSAYIDNSKKKRREHKIFILSEIVIEKVLYMQGREPVHHTFTILYYSLQFLPHNYHFHYTTTKSIIFITPLLYIFPPYILLLLSLLYIIHLLFLLYIHSFTLTIANLFHSLICCFSYYLIKLIFINSLISIPFFLYLIIT